MNQMILHSKCMAARDQQVDEKARGRQAAAAEERRVVQEMEARRQAGLAELEVGAAGRRGSLDGVGGGGGRFLLWQLACAVCG
jgi:hypothetical protein